MAAAPANSTITAGAVSLRRRRGGLPAATRRPSSRGSALASSARRRGSRPSSSAGTTRCRSARACRRRAASSRRRRARNAWPTRVRGGRATTEPARTGCSSSPRMQTPSPSSTTKTSSSEEWQWTRAVELPRRDVASGSGPVSTEPAAAPSSRELSPNSPRSRSSGSTSSSRTTFGGRPPGSGSSGSGERALELPLVRQVDVEERRADPELLDPREPVVAAGPRAPPVAVGEHVEAVGPGDERVRRPGREVDEAGPRGRPRRRRPRRCSVALPREARAAEHEEDLLVVAVRSAAASSGSPDRSGCG